MTRTIAAALLLATVLGTALTGCGPLPREMTALPPGPEASVTDTSDIPPSATAGTEGLNQSGLDRELDAMERELDQLDMPSDADFGGAEDALY